jgi:hypothetical protein
MTWVSCFLFWEVFEGYGELFVKVPHRIPFYSP